MMRRKILWITFWMTMVFWLGGSMGCAANPDEHNYKMLEEEDRQLQSEPYSVSPLHQALVAVVLAGNDVTMGTIRTSTLDRSHWPALVTGPDDGGVSHNPHYFQDCPIEHRDPMPNRSMTHVQRFDAAMDEVEPGGWDSVNVKGLVTQPLKFVFDLVALPVRMFQSPPRSTVTTPAE